MVRRTWIVGLCLIVALAVSALIAAGAEASTEIVSSPVCVKANKSGSGKNYSGHYIDKRCTIKASEEEIALGGKLNKYELDPGPTWKGKGHAVKHVTAKLVSAQMEILCKKSVSSGMVLSSTRVQATFKFSGCSTGPTHQVCTTHGREQGEIETKPLLGVVGEGAGNEPVVSFTGKEAASTEPAPAQTFAEFECAEVPFTLHGTLSGSWIEVGKMSKKGGIDFAVGTGEQGLIEQFPNAVTEETEEEAITLEATQLFKFGADYEMT